jgi:hypothetical protein
MSTEQTLCSNPICECTVTATLDGLDAFEAYCSDYCKAADTTNEDDTICACGHPPCDGA